MLCIRDFKYWVGLFPKDTETEDYLFEQKRSDLIENISFDLNKGQKKCKNSLNQILMCEGDIFYLPSSDEIMRITVIKDDTSSFHGVNLEEIESDLEMMIKT